MFKRILTNRLIPLSVLVLLMSSSLSFAEVIDGEELVDPTRPLLFEMPDGVDGGSQGVIRSVDPSGYDVSFVRVSGATSIAVLNGQRVTIGDVIGGATVAVIDRSGVTLMIDDQERRVNIYENSIKAQAANQ